MYWLNTGCNAFISIHAPREGGDYSSALLDFDPILFQSTPPARGATGRKSSYIAQQEFQSTPPARGATYFHRKYPVLVEIFQSTPPARGATVRLFDKLS